MLRILLWMAIVCGLCVSAFGQVEEGTIVGTVTDPSGSAVPAAVVSITNAGTGSSFEVKTNESGEFTSPPLRPGNYAVAVNVSGFEKTTQTISLDVNQRAAPQFSPSIGIEHARGQRICRYSAARYANCNTRQRSDNERIERFAAEWAQFHHAINAGSRCYACHRIHTELTFAG